MPNGIEFIHGAVWFCPNHWSNIQWIAKSITSLPKEIPIKFSFNMFGHSCSKSNSPTMRVTYSQESAHERLYRISIQHLWPLVCAYTLHSQSDSVEPYFQLGCFLIQYVPNTTIYIQCYLSITAHGLRKVTAGSDGASSIVWNIHLATIWCRGCLFSAKTPWATQAFINHLILCMKYIWQLCDEMNMRWWSERGNSFTCVSGNGVGWWTGSWKCGICDWKRSCVTKY